MCTTRRLTGDLWETIEKQAEEQTMSEVAPNLDELIALGEKASPGPWKFEKVCDLGAMIVQDQQGGAPSGWCIARLMMDTDFDDSLPEQASKNGPYVAAACNAAVPLAKRLKRIGEILGPQLEALFTADEANEIRELLGDVK